MPNPSPQERLTRALADRYRIEREIGSGGMATVYLAQDLKHDRQVAVKVLDPDLAQNLGAERFLREIRTAANLSHPHILPLFDSGEADGFLYYVMPYAKGESLRTRLTKEKQLPVEDAIRITREIADALAYAHEEGVIHRDVKPANIMLEAGHAVLADFGIAQAVAEAKDERLTRTGTSLGTPAYMSPEQATGEQDLDGRSDQYALGCVLYEMLAGHPPFTGAQVEAVIRQHLTEEPPSVTRARPSVTEEVVKVINRALSKSPADRFRTTGEMAAALALTKTPNKAGNRWGRPKALVYAGTVILGLATVAVIASRRAGGGIDPSLHRVVVMPLENRTGDPSLDAYGNWAADHIASGLLDAQLTKVVPFQDVAAIKNQTVPKGVASPGLGDLGQDWPEKLAATLAVRGSFYSLPPGDSIEFRLQVVDPEGTVRGTVTPVRGAAEDPNEALRTLQVQVVGTVAGIVVPNHQLATLAVGRRPPKLEAFQALVEGWTTFASSYEAAIPILKRAIELDPEYFRPLVVLQAAYGNLQRYAEADSLCQIIEERIDQADAVGRLEAELVCPNTSVEHRARVDIARDLAKLTPGHNYILGLTLLNVNRPREAAEAFERYDTTLGTIGLEWEDTNAYFWAVALHVLGEHSRELEVVREVRQRFPDYSDLIYQEIGALIALDRHDEARRMIEDQLALLPPGQGPGTLLQRAGQEYDAHGHPEEARELWERALGWYAGRPAEEVGTESNRLWRAWFFLYLDRLEEAEHLLVSLVLETSGDVASRGPLGILKAKQADREGAEQVSQALAAWDPPVRNGGGTVWQARISAQLGDLDEAVRLLERAMEEGWGVRDIPHRDSFLRPLRGYPPFVEFMRPKG